MNKSSSSGNGLRLCVYGGQYGSEGKGCVAEHLLSTYYGGDKKIIVFGENSPNSGHTNSRGKTRSLPVSAHFADVVMLGPDSAIDPHMLAAEIRNIKVTRPGLQVYIHDTAAIITEEERKAEGEGSLVKRIASTASGGGAARAMKALHRTTSGIMKQCLGMFPDFEVIDRIRWFELITGFAPHDWLFECSQGMLLDLNLGIYPYVTSRTTHPRAAIERNGLGPSFDWSFIGVFRTYPIRTGGNSGPTGGRELQWGAIGVPQEVATVTKRVRRVFEFSGADFIYSINTVRPDAIAFTHLDYLPQANRTPDGFLEWLGRSVGLGQAISDVPSLQDVTLYTSDAPGLFATHGKVFNGGSHVKI